MRALEERVARLERIVALLKRLGRCATAVEFEQVLVELREAEKQTNQMQP